MTRYKLRTLLIVSALGPPLLAVGDWASFMRDQGFIERHDESVDA